MFFVFQEKISLFFFGTQIGSTHAQALHQQVRPCFVLFFREKNLNFLGETVTKTISSNDLYRITRWCYYSTICDIEGGFSGGGGG